MRKHAKKLFILILSFALLSISYFIEQRRDQNTIHVFFEVYATTPELMEAIAFVQLPPEKMKIIGWHRFPKRGKKIDLRKLNTIEFDIPPREGLYLDQPKKFTNFIKKVYQIKPNAYFVFYSNMSQIKNQLFPILREIPRDRVREIHLYEDGLGYGIGSMYKHQNRKNIITNPLKYISIFDKYLKKEENVFYAEYYNLLQIFYPTIYHFLGADQIKKRPEYQNFVKKIGKKNIKDINFEKIRSQLSPAQKSLLFALLDFDYNYWKKLMKNKKTVVFTTGFVFGNKNEIQAQINILRELRQGKLKNLLSPNSYIWFYKPHPSFSSEKETPLLIKKEFPDMIEIPARIPFEVFIIADLTPDYVFGYSSSLFYALPQKNILGIITRPNKSYYKGLQRYFKNFSVPTFEPADFFGKAYEMKKP